MTVQEIDEVVSKRRVFLAALSEEPATKPELVERVDASRSTIDRAIDDLESHDFVTRPDDKYRLTLAGKQAYECHRSYLDDIADIATANEILASLPPDVPFTLDLLDDADVECAQPHDPMHPLEQSREIISGANRLQLVSPAVYPVCVDVIREGTDDGMELELVVPEEAIDTLTDRYDDSLCWVDNDGSQLYELEAAPPYMLWITETPDGEYTGLVSHSDTGVRGLIVNDDEQSREWARQEYERYRDQSTPVETVPGRA